MIWTTEAQVVRKLRPANEEDALRPFDTWERAMSFINLSASAEAARLDDDSGPLTRDAGRTEVHLGGSEALAGNQLMDSWAECVDGASAESRFFTLGWFRAWLKTYGTRSPWTGKARVYVSKTQEGAPLAIAPMAVAQRCGFELLSLGGYVQPARVLLLNERKPQMAAETAVEALMGDRFAWQALRLAPIDLAMPGHREFVEQLQQRCAGMEVREQPPTIVCDELPEDFEAYQQKVLGTRLSKDLHYFERRLNREGGMVIRHHHNPRGAELEQVLRELRQIESRSGLAERKGGRPRFMADLDFEFWRGVAEAGLGEESSLDIWVMHFADRPISFCLTLTAGATRYMIANQFDLEYRKYSTGSVLYHYAMKQAIETGVRRVDFGEGDPHYKSRWGGVESGQRCEVIAFRPSIPGRVIAWIRSAMTSVRKRGMVGEWLRSRTSSSNGASPLAMISGWLIGLGGNLSAEMMLLSAVGA